MKSNTLFRICTTAALGTVVVLGASRLTLWARDNQPGITVSATPINRDLRLGNSYAPIVKKAAPSVVNIYSARFVKQRYYRGPMMSDPFFRQFERTRRENSLGSGIIVSADGYILTANHVVEGADEIKVGISNDKTEYVAKLVGSDPATDIAVLKISARNLPAIVLGDSSQLEVGDVVLAIGNPFGLGQTVTRGIISALGRSLPDIDDGNTPQRYQDFIQTDASINKGNSGGALVDAEGRLIGINDAIVSPSGTSAGIGFAVPINMARNVMEGIISGGRVARGYLGINPQDVDAGLAQSFGVPNSGGALVTDVGPNTPAAKAGLVSGDVITAINDKQISGADNLRVTVSQLRPGSAATVKFIRNRVEKSVVATLGELPGGNSLPESQVEPAHPQGKADMLDGVVIVELDAQFRQQFRVPSDLNGAVVAQVSPDSNSAQAGLRPYDLILEINRKPVNNATDAERLCKGSRGSQILVKVWRHNGNLVGTRYLSVNNEQRKK
jgi:serine protease Do